MLLLKKAFGVLEALAAVEGASSLADLTRTLGMPKPTVYRILRTLVELGYASQDPSTLQYALTGRLSLLGRGARMGDLKRRALPLMERVHRKFNETVNLAVLEGTDVVYRHAIETTQPLRLMTRPGARDPFHTTSLGRAVAAFLPEEERRSLLERADLKARTSKPPLSRKGLEALLGEVRRRGWAEDREENEPGIVCFGVPLLEGSYPAAALSLTLPVVRLGPRREREIVAELLVVARKGLRVAGGGSSDETTGAMSGMRRVPRA